jgi:hypothetical protein
LGAYEAYTKWKESLDEIQYLALSGERDEAEERLSDEGLRQYYEVLMTRINSMMILQQRRPMSLQKTLLSFFGTMARQLVIIGFCHSCHFNTNRLQINKECADTAPEISETTKRIHEGDMHARVKYTIRKTSLVNLAEE